MTSDAIRLLTPLTPAECASRLRAAIDIERSVVFSFAGLFGSKPVVGRIAGAGVRLRKRIRYRNSFQTYLTARIKPGPDGTIICGRLAIHPVVRGFMFVWFGSVILIGAALFVASIGSMLSGPALRQPNTWLGMVIPPAMLAFGYGLVRIGRYLAREEARFLTDFLIRTLDAHPEE